MAMRNDCPFCKDSVEPDESIQCPICGTLHHRVCWNENRKCSIFGCAGKSQSSIRTKYLKKVYGSAANLFLSGFFLFLIWFYASGVAWQFFELYWKQSVMTVTALAVLVFSIE